MNIINNFIGYFSEINEYPEDKVFNPLPMDSLYCYVASTFLDGFINYVTIVKAFVIARYSRWDDVLFHPPQISIKDEDQTNYVLKRFNTKTLAFEAITKPGAIFHPKFSYFRDDVMILAKAFDKTNTEFCWVYFYYDRDTSDCEIGRFKTTDDDKFVIRNFNNYVQTFRTTLGEEEKEIPLSLFGQGWLSY